MTLDFWSSIQAKSVLGIKVQFLDDDWVLRNITIGFKHFQTATTAENLKSAVENLLLKEYGLKLTQVVKSNTSNDSYHEYTFKILIACSSFLQK